MSWLFTETFPVCKQTETQLACLSLKDRCGGNFSKCSWQQFTLTTPSNTLMKEGFSSQCSNLRGSHSALAAHYWNSRTSKGKSTNRENETFFVKSQVVEYHEWYNYEYKHILTCLISNLLAKSRVAAAPRALHVRPLGQRM